MGWLSAPDRQAVFCICGSCSNCEDEELEAKIVAQISAPLNAIRRETTDAAAPTGNPTPAPAPMRAIAPSASADTRSTDFPPAAAEDKEKAKWATAAARKWIEPVILRERETQRAQPPAQRTRTPEARAQSTPAA
jgi:hypothetical protein